MPAKYRDRLQEICDGKLIATVHWDRCLLLYPMSEWLAIEEVLTKAPNLKGRVREMQRLLMGRANEVELDGAGRILLSASLREVVRLDKRVVLAGQGKKFELWDEQRWAEREERLFNGEGGDEKDWTLPPELESLSL